MYRIYYDPVTGEIISTITPLKFASTEGSWIDVSEPIKISEYKVDIDTKQLIKL